MGNLKEIVEKINKNQVSLIEMEKYILGFKVEKSEIEEKILRSSSDIQKSVYFNPDFKNEKQRDLAIADLTAENSDLVGLKISQKSLSHQIELAQISKMEFKAEYDYYRNLLKVAEIEAIAMKGDL